MKNFLHKKQKLSNWNKMENFLHKKQKRAGEVCCWWRGAEKTTKSRRPQKGNLKRTPETPERTLRKGTQKGKRFCEVFKFHSLTTEGRLQKKTVLSGKNSHVGRPPPPPVWERPCHKNFLRFILRFRTLGTFLVFTKMLTFCDKVMWEQGNPPSATPVFAISP